MRLIAPARKTQAAMSLMEMMVGMGITSLLLALIMTLSAFTARSFAAISNYVALDRASRKALDQLSMMVREGDGVTDFKTNKLTLSYHGEELIYEFKPTERGLYETWKGETKELLGGCDDFQFSVFQRNSMEGTYEQFPATFDVNAAKIVQVSWICSRQLLGKLINTESIQSAKIVIRKQ